MLSEILGERGWNTYLVGKWHLTPEDECHMAAPRTRWPLGRGFERFYGFMDGETHQYTPASSAALRRPRSGAETPSATAERSP